MDKTQQQNNAPNELSLSALIMSYNILPKTNESFGGYIKRIMNFKKITNKNLSDRTGLSEPTISRYLQGTAKSYTAENVLAMIISVELVSTQIEAALRLAGVRIDNTSSKRNCIIQLCLDRCSLSGIEKMTVASCNRLLKAEGEKPLTQKGIDGYPD